MNPMSAVLATASRWTSCSIERSRYRSSSFRPRNEGADITRAFSNSPPGVGAFSQRTDPSGSVTRITHACSGGFVSKNSRTSTVCAYPQAKRKRRIPSSVPSAVVRGTESSPSGPGAISPAFRASLRSRSSSAPGARTTFRLLTGDQASSRRLSKTASGIPALSRAVRITSGRPSSRRSGPTLRAASRALERAVISRSFSM